MQTELIYDISQQGFAEGPWLVAAGVAFLLALAAWWRQRRLKRPAGLQAFFIAMTGVATREGDRSQRRILRLERLCAAACTASQG